MLMLLSKFQEFLQALLFINQLYVIDITSLIAKLRNPDRQTVTLSEAIDCFARSGFETLHSGRTAAPILLFTSLLELEE
jgi:hypothetical protein